MKKEESAGSNSSRHADNECRYDTDDTVCPVVKTWLFYCLYWGMVISIH